MSEILVVRHGLSTANDRNNRGTPAYGHPDAGLMPEGQVAAEELNQRFLDDFRLNPAKTPAATSQLRRTRETAAFAGFIRLRPLAELNEIRAQDMQAGEYQAAKDNIAAPRAAILAAEALLKRPPKERVWFTHGMIIAGLTAVQGDQKKYDRIIPRFCEVRRFRI